ncbi:MAG: glycoside hydrolase family 3 protein [Anaerolineae bacterium]|nr:glycoside hydrolase family 3 protein [Anaerolineae bacterium]
MDLKAKPFYLNDADIRWVESTLAGMDRKEKVGQLFCLMFMGEDGAAYLRQLEADGIRPGGMLARTMPGIVAQNTVRAMQAQAKIPLLVPANLERGGDGMAADGTQFANPLQIAATDDETHAYRLGLIAGREGRAVGCNWAFAPVIDIDYNYHNPITNTRTYGSDPDRVLRMAKAYMKGLQECGLAVSIKHWPGDGVDGRDQHLLTSVNTLSVEEWDATYGKVYQGMIDAGARTVMSAHIMLPAYSRKLRPGIQDTEIHPATLADELNNDLLRGQLGFNGLVVSDATPMAGFAAAMRRDLSVPGMIASGVDMYLFSVNIHKEFQMMLDGIEKGILTEARLDEAVTRILALKASLKLHKQQADGSLVPGIEALSVLQCEQHQAWARECADLGVTLVKDTQHLLPLDPATHKRVLLYVLGDKGGFMGEGKPTHERFVTRLEENGFEVTKFDYDAMRGPAAWGSPISRDPLGFLSNFDVVLYYASLTTASNQTAVRITWGFPMGVDVPKFVHDIPTAFVSVANPYHLQDVPMVKTFVNAYTPSEYVIDAVVDKLVGKSAFKGINPVDPFCGYWDARL